MDIFKMALVIIYLDGYVDYIPIKTGCANHVAYWYDYLKISPRFQRLIRENRFKFNWIDEYNTSPILKLLAKNDVIVFTNIEIAYVCNNIENAEVFSRFSISLPAKFEEHKGLLPVREMIDKLGEDQYKLDVFRTNRNYFDKMAPEEYEKILGKNKVNEEEGKKL